MMKLDKNDALLALRIWSACVQKMRFLYGGEAWRRKTATSVRYESVAHRAIYYNSPTVKRIEAAGLIHCFEDGVMMKEEFLRMPATVFMRTITEGGGDEAHD